MSSSISSVEPEPNHPFSDPHPLAPDSRARLPKSEPLVYLVAGATPDEPLGQVLRDAGFRLRVFASPDEFRAACGVDDTQLPDAVVLDLDTADDNVTAASLLDYIKAKQACCPPVVVVSERDDLNVRLAALRAGASSYLLKPVDSERLIGLLCALIGRQPPEPYRVLMVDDDELVLKFQAAMLRSAGMTVHALSQPLQTLTALRDFQPDMVVLDVHMPGATGLELAAVLREHDELLHVPILFLSSETDIAQQLLALSLGGDDFLVKPVAPERLVATVRARIKRGRQNRIIRQRLQAALYEREREHLALDQHAIVSVTDRAGNITYVNDKFCTVSGYARGELLGKNHRLIRSGEHPPEFYQDLWRTIASGNVWQGEICNRRKDGSLYWVASTITPFIDAAGSPYQYVSIRTDITHVKAAEASLKASEARFRYLVSASPVTIYTCAATSPYGATFISMNVKALMGYAPEQFTQDSAFWANNIHPDDRRRVFAELPKLFEHGRHIQEYRFRVSDGSYRWMHDELRLTRDVTGRPSEMIGYWLDITERKHAEQAAEAHKERLRRGQVYANIGTWDWNIETGELYWTERIASLFGYPEGELETSYPNFLAAVHPDDRQAVIDAINACIEHDVPYEIEHRVVWPDGSERWLLERGAVMRDASGKALQMLGVVQDIDDRKRAELALAERERQLREAQHLARIGNWSADLVTGELTWSDEIYRIFGHEPNSFAPSVQAFVAAVHPDDREMVRESEEQARFTGSHDVVHRIVRPDGTVRHVHELAQAETDAAGNLVRLTGTVQDITERRQAENALAERERFMKTLVDILPGMVGYWNRDLCCDFANLGYLEWFGKTPEQMRGIHLQELLGEALFRKNEPFVLGALGGEVQHFERTLTKADGSTGYTWAHYIPDIDQGQVQGFFAVVSDITDIKLGQVRLEEFNAALTHARDEADRANQAKSEFLASMSHELRTPMNAILGFSQLMEFDSSLPEAHKDSVHEIIKAGQHLLELINEVLDLARVESGHIDLSLESVEVCPIVEECMSLVRLLAQKRDIQFSHKGLEGVCVRADRTRLKQILLNLLSNAIKYNRHGGSIQVEVRPQGSHQVRILVIDTGPGIPEQRMKELFQPFGRLGVEHMQVEGTGIGLIITRRIVEMMGGAVGAESTVGIGSTFWIELPREDLAAAPDREAGRGDRIQATATGVQHTLLYIEDNPANLMLMTQILGSRPHIRLLTAHSPELGIDMARAYCPEAILLDINMAGMDGYKVLEILQAEASLKDIPVVAVTANVMPLDIERGKSAGFADYVTKPIDLVRFYGLLDRLLGKRPDGTS